MSRSCHSGMPSITGTIWRARSRARPQIRSHRIGFFLCGIAHEPFWPGAERLGQLAHLGALAVPDLERDRLADRRQHRQRGHPLADAVADHDLGGDVGRPQPERGGDVLLDRRVDVGVGADRAGDLGDADRLAGPPQPVA